MAERVQGINPLMFCYSPCVIRHRRFIKCRRRADGSPMNFDNRNLQELVVKAHLVIARSLLDSGKPEEAEEVYKQTLDQADAISGEGNLLAGLVLLELFELYENQGRHDEAAPVWSRIRQIVLMNMQWRDQAI